MSNSVSQYATESMSWYIKDFKETLRKKLYDENINELDLTSAKIHLIVTKDKVNFPFDKVIKKTNSMKVIKAIPTVLDEALSEEKIGKVFCDCIRFRLDLFLKDAQNRFLWLEQEYETESSMGFDSSITNLLSADELVSHYTTWQKKVGKEIIPIVDKNGELVSSN